MSEKFIMPNKASGSNSKAIESSVTKSSHSLDQHAELFLEDLGMGISGTIVVMIGRMWDVNAVSGRYLSTDFVVTDAKVSLHYIYNYACRFRLLNSDVMFPRVSQCIAMQGVV